MKRRITPPDEGTIVAINRAPVTVGATVGLDKNFRVLLQQILLLIISPASCCAACFRTRVPQERQFPPND